MALSTQPQGKLLDYEQYIDHQLSRTRRDRKSTRLNSSHQIISYAVFCLKKKNITSLSSQNTSQLTNLLTTWSRCRLPNISPCFNMIHSACRATDIMVVNTDKQ